MSLEDFRRQYSLGGLTRDNLPSSPLALFSDWMQQAMDRAPAEWVEPYIMMLATSTRTGDVSARIVLLREYGDDGFAFYTNYESVKGKQIAANQRAALVFYWAYLERQVRVEGAVVKASREKSAAYFRKRPRGSQISAAVSRQSEPIENRAWLENKTREFEEQLGDGPVPLPDDWGGYLVVPERMEFWHGRPDRLHDRILYSQTDQNAWEITRLSP